MAPSLGRGSPLRLHLLLTGSVDWLTPLKPLHCGSSVRAGVHPQGLQGVWSEPMNVFCTPVPSSRLHLQTSVQPDLLQLRQLARGREAVKPWP